MNIDGKKIFYIGLAVAGLAALTIIFRKKIMGYLAPVYGVVSSKFGYRIDPITGKQNSFHNGVDLAVPENTPLRSPMDGVISSVWFDKDNGNGVRITHDNNWITGYAHNNKILLKKGDKVKRGEIFALSGNTGKSTGAHVHFKLQNPQGQDVDPEKHIKFKT